MTLFIHRLFGSAVLDRDTYEEVEADRSATIQAFVIVLLSSMATGIGLTGFGGRASGNILIMSAVAVVGWAAWALLTFEIGGRLLRQPQTRVDVPELMRTLGFAATPGLLRVFGVVPELTVPVFALTGVWMLVAMVVAVRQALDYTSTTRAVAVCLFGWTLATVFAVALGLFVSSPLV